MSDRDDDFRRLVPMLPGWTVSEPDGNLVKSLRAFRRADYASFGLPAPDAPLPEAMAFVGRIAEALGPGITLDAVNNDRAHGWMVRFAKPWPTLFRGTAPDLAWAACRAAIAARKGGTNGHS